MKSRLLLVIMVIAFCIPAFARTQITLDNIIYELKAAPDGSGDGVATVIGNDLPQKDSYDSPGVDVTIPESVTHEGKEYKVTDIGASAFEGCGSLDAVYVPATVEFIRSKAFYNTSLQDFFLSSAETIVSPDALSMNKVQRLILPETMTAFPVTSVGRGNILITYSKYDKIEDDVILSYDGEEVICAFVKKQGAYEIPASVTIIDNNAFLNCDQLTVLSGGASIESIGDGAFRCCKLMTGFTPGAALKTIGAAAFRGCTSLASISLTDNVTSVGDYAFADCTGLTQAIIDGNMTSVGDYAFTKCTGLIKVVLGENIEQLGTYIFLDCSKLSDVEVKCEIGTVPEGMFKNCGLTEFPIKSGIKEIAFEAFRGNPFGTVKLPEGLEIIGDDGFCFGSTTVVYLPSTLKSIGWRCFYYTSLEDIYCAALTPPSVASDAFWNNDRDLWHNLQYYENRHLYIPASPDHSVLELYKNNSEWGLFKNIQEDANLGVADIEVGSDAPEEYFTIDGVKLSSRPTAPGIYILRKGSRSVKIAL